MIAALIVFWTCAAVIVTADLQYFDEYIELLQCIIFIAHSFLNNSVPLRGIPMLHDGAIWPICRTLILNVSWGLGLSLILPWLQPRPLFRPRLGTKSA